MAAPPPDRSRPPLRPQALPVPGVRALARSSRRGSRWRTSRSGGCDLRSLLGMDLKRQQDEDGGEQPHRATAKFPEACILYFEMSRIVLLSNETVPCTETVPST